MPGALTGPLSTRARFDAELFYRVFGIFRPFARTGTSLVADDMLSRRYTRIDKDEEYIAIIKERLRECVPTRQRFFVVNAS